MRFTRSLAFGNEIYYDIVTTMKVFSMIGVTIFFEENAPLFASGEIRQIASVEKRQFGSAEIRQFESIEKSQS